MSGYTDKSNIENSRNCLRRIIHDDQEFSNQSIIYVIDRFVKTVNLMQETILIPSRLLDCQVEDSKSDCPQNASSYICNRNAKKSTTNVRDSLANTDLFHLYNTLNSVKVDLLWGRNEEKDVTTDIQLKEQNYDTVEENSKTELKINEVSGIRLQPTLETKGHARSSSTVSVSSSNSSSSVISDTDSEVSSNENDSGIESGVQKHKEQDLEVALRFRRHLRGLNESLDQMTQAANYLTIRYQRDIGDIGT